MEGAALQKKDPVEATETSSSEVVYGTYVVGEKLAGEKAGRGLRPRSLAKLRRSGVRTLSSPTAVCNGRGNW